MNSIMKMSIRKIIPEEFNYISRKVREFFHEKGLIECYPQTELSILAACEDPQNLTTFQYVDETWPLPQTNQMHLEDIILKYGQKYNGFFCITTSYRQEKNPVKDRHDLIFPMIEFEILGGMDKLIEFEKEFLEHLGFGKKEEFPEGDYLDLCKKYGVDELDHKEEMQLNEDYGSVFFLKNFPESTSPFWNMKNNSQTGLAEKVDVIVCGIETFGSASRSCNRDEMRNSFQTISDGEYAETLYRKFGRTRVEEELETYLKHDFFERSGCGIGYTRLARAMRLCNLFKY